MLNFISAFLSENALRVGNWRPYRMIGVPVKMCPCAPPPGKQGRWVKPMRMIESHEIGLTDSSCFLYKVIWLVPIPLGAEKRRGIAAAAGAVYSNRENDATRETLVITRKCQIEKNRVLRRDFGELSRAAQRDFSLV
jgi:hypothetical protein